MKLFIFTIMIVVVGCNIFKTNSTKIENWKKHCFNNDFSIEEVKTITFYKVVHQRIVESSEIKLPEKVKKSFLNCLDSLEYNGMTISQYKYAIKIQLEDTIYQLWGTGAYIGPYKTAFTYSMPSKFNIMNEFFINYIDL